MVSTMRAPETAANNVFRCGRVMSENMLCSTDDPTERLHTAPTTRPTLCVGLCGMEEGNAQVSIMHQCAS